MAADEPAILDILFDIVNNRAMEPFAGMETFVCVIDAGSFTAAAERLQTAKSSVSETIRALEERLGVRLLDRSTRHVQPTEAGRLFYQRCRRLIDEAKLARAEVQASSGALAGHIRMAAPEGFAARYIVPSLREFLAQFPSIDVELVEAQEVTRLVEENIDLAIRIAETPEETLVVRHIGTSQVIIVAAPGYLAEHGTPAAPADVANHQLIGFSKLIWRNRWRIGTGAIDVNPRLLTNSTESLRTAAIAGLGITALPEWLVRDALADGRLQRLFEEEATPSSGIYAVYPTNRLIAPRVREIVDHLAGEFERSGLGRR